MQAREQPGRLVGDDVGGARTRSNRSSIRCGIGSGTKGIAVVGAAPRVNR